MTSRDPNDSSPETMSLRSRFSISDMASGGCLSNRRALPARPARFRRYLIYFALAAPSSRPLLLWRANGYTRYFDQICQAHVLNASLLHPHDDVATALVDLPVGKAVQVASGGIVRDVKLVDRIPLGHKFAVRDLDAGLRVRKYGECIGRLSSDVRAGGWVHEHNLETSAKRDPRHERAWCEQRDLPVRAIGSARTSVGECPLYDARSNQLWWIDVRETPAIHSLDLESAVERHWPLGEDIGSIALTHDAKLLAALRSGFAFFDPSRGELAPIVDPEAHLPHNRMNDGRCDVAGRFWCGSMNPESGRAEGSLYVLDSALHARRVQGDYFVPNGIVWGLDNRTMLCADTRRGIIDAFDFDVQQGTLSERRRFAELGALPGGPDGATVDSQGFFWSAQFDGGCVIRYAPDGRMDRVVRLPVTKPTACTFGGRDYATLFVTTATRGLSAERLSAEPLAGQVLVLDVGVAGFAPVPFGGPIDR